FRFADHFNLQGGVDVRVMQTGRLQRRALFGDWPALQDSVLPGNKVRRRMLGEQRTEGTLHVETFSRVQNPDPRVGVIAERRVARSGDFSALDGKVTDAIDPPVAA